MRAIVILALLIPKSFCSNLSQNEYAPDFNGNLAVTYEVLDNLTKASSHSFASTFFKISPEKLLCALKEVSIWANLLTNSAKNLTSTADNDVILKMNGYIEVLEENIKSEWKIQNKQLEPLFETRVYLSLAVIMRIHGVYRRKPKAKFENFEWVFERAGLSHLLVTSSPILRNVTESSRYNRNSFNEMRGFLARCLFHIYTVEYFRIGVFSDDVNDIRKNLKHSALQDDESEDLDESFQRSYKNMSTVFNETFNDFNKAYFPGSIVEDIIRPAIDKNREDSCDIAQNIVDKLKTEKSSWREYVVIVSTTISSLDQYAYFGLKKRVIAEKYKDNMVLVFMASKNFTRNKSVYQKEKGREAISLMEKTADWNNLNSSVKYARNGREDVQIAVRRGFNNVCIRPENMHAYDSLEMHPFIGGETSFPFNVNVVVVF